jgi:hypothetical protein
MCSSTAAWSAAVAGAVDGDDGDRAEFESASLPEQVEAVIASTSLHHVANPADVID